MPRPEAKAVPTELASARQDLARLRCIFDHAGGRGVELADEIDALELKIEALEAKAGAP